MTGIDIIAEERKRQIEEEGWTTEHDAEHTNEALAKAAVCYALPQFERWGIRKALWPFEEKWWKPSPDDRVKELAKAGALIAAEIDRLLKDKD